MLIRCFCTEEDTKFGIKWTTRHTMMYPCKTISINYLLWCGFVTKASVRTLKQSCSINCALPIWVPKGQRKLDGKMGPSPIRMSQLGRVASASSRPAPATGSATSISVPVKEDAVTCFPHLFPLVSPLFFSCCRC